jgi:hypothetical protein
MKLHYNVITILLFLLFALPSFGAVHLVSRSVKAAVPPVRKSAQVSVQKSKTAAKTAGRLSYGAAKFLF